MRRELSHVIRVGWLVAAVVFTPVWPLMGDDASAVPTRVIVHGGLMTVFGILPAYALAVRKVWDRTRLPLCVRLVFTAFAWSAVLSLFVGVLIAALPHGWGALEWEQLRLRTLWIATFLVPASLLTWLAFLWADWIRVPDA
ncbi:hypothetical protein [Streptomyces sp. NPDC057939]|uniref:hypothetical protein n=1 Tax=Streptomyces sp. NPDC057939 TaxID=3346284 RepID=UPI0036EB5554